MTAIVPYTAAVYCHGTMKGKRTNPTSKLPAMPPHPMGEVCEGPLMLLPKRTGPTSTLIHLPTGCSLF